MVPEAVPRPDDEFRLLLARVRGGDQAAAAELVGRYERAVLRCVRSRLSQSLRGALDSMDVMQSVHRSLFSGLKSDRFHFASPHQLIGLAVVMVERKVARHWRKLKQSRAAKGGTEIARALPLEALAGDESLPGETVAANDLLEQLLAQLDEFDRQLVRLKLAGHSSAESAAVLQRDPAFVRMRWSRLRQLLRRRGFAPED